MNPRYAMPRKYRVLFLDRCHDVTRDASIHAYDDGSAMDLVGNLARGQTVEVWDGLRQVVPPSRMPDPRH